MNIPGFSIKRTIGKGGMATVYLAERAKTGDMVALKTVRAPDGDPSNDETVATGPETVAIERFVNEGRVIAAITHPNVVRIYECGESDATLFIAMEYVSGGDLRDRLEGVVRPDFALNTVMRIGAALHAAHHRGVVHRDVKPANILYREDDTPLLSDFGIAKDVHTDLTLTGTGNIVGSPLYISPEQASGESVDGRSDIYSLGAVLYEALVGKPPYRGKSPMDVMIQHVQSPVPKMPLRKRRYQPLMDRMLAKDPDDRFANAGELVRVVAELLRTPDRRVSDLVSEAAQAPGDLEKTRRSRRTRGADRVVRQFHDGILEDIEYDRLVLPSLPEVVLQVRSTLERGDASGHEIARVIATDPALSAQVLKMANSAFYAGQGVVNDLERAVVRLGLNVVGQVVMMLVVAQLYDVNARPKLKPYLAALWRHSTLVAALAEQIAARTPGLKRDVAMLAGLIHDIGALPVLVWAEQIPHVINNPDTLRGVIGDLHAQLGGAILRRWRYPEELLMVPEQHEQLERASCIGDDPDYVDTVLIANILAVVDTEHELADVDWRELPACKRLKLGDTEALDLLAKALDQADELARSLGGGAAETARQPAVRASA